VATHPSEMTLTIENMMRVLPIRSSARLILIAGFAILLLLGAQALVSAQEADELYPLPDELPATEVLTDAVAAVDAEERPVTEVLPADLAVTGFDIGAPLALGSLLVLLGGAILVADRWYRNRLGEAVA
jgi:hypothetical protein